MSLWKKTKRLVVTDNAASKFSWMLIGCYAEKLTHEFGDAISFGQTAARPR